MHILFLSDCFPPEVNAPASRTFEHCRQWVEAGHQVTVITCAPNFPKGKVFPGYRNRLWQSETIEGIRVIRVWSFIAANARFGRRILDYVSYMVTATIAALFVRRVDVIVGTSPQIFTTCAAFAAALLKRRPWVFELRDLWPASIKAVGAMRSERTLKALEGLELFLYRRATAIVAVTNSFKRDLVERGIDGAKISIATNGVDLSRFKPQPKDPSLVAQYGLTGKFVAGYIGTHGMAHGLDTLLDAAAKLQKSDMNDVIRILFIGDGAARVRLIERAKELQLRNVIFIESVPKEAVARFWALLDLAIIHLRKDPVFEAVIPSKLFECMGMGIPVLHGVAGESADIVRSYELGSTFEPEDAEQLERHLMRLSLEADEIERLARNCRSAASQFDRAAIANRMLEVIEGLQLQPQSQPHLAEPNPS